MVLARILPSYVFSVRGIAITVQRIESVLRDHDLRREVTPPDRRDLDATPAGFRRLHLTPFTRRQGA
jgi:hypothetical protein